MPQLCHEDGTDFGNRNDFRGVKFGEAPVHDFCVNDSAYALYLREQLYEERYRDHGNDNILHCKI